MNGDRSQNLTLSREICQQMRLSDFENGGKRKNIRNILFWESPNLCSILHFIGLYLQMMHRHLINYLDVYDMMPKH